MGLILAAAIQLLIWQRFVYFVESSCEYPFQPLKDPAHPKELLYCNLHDSSDICPLRSTCEDLWLGLFVCCGYNLTVGNDTASDAIFSEKQHKLENPNFAASHRKNVRILFPEDEKVTKLNSSAPTTKKQPGTILMYFTTTSTPATSNMYSTLANENVHVTANSTEIIEEFEEDANVSTHIKTTPTVRVPENHKTTKHVKEEVLKNNVEQLSKNVPLYKINRNETHNQSATDKFEKVATNEDNNSPRNHSHEISDKLKSYFEPIIKSAPQIFILQEGLSHRVNSTSYKFPATITLIMDHGKTIVVDTGLPTDYELLGLFLTELSRYGVEADTVDVVVTTHGHPDHFGHLNLFSTAIQIFGGLIYVGNTFSVSDLYANEVAKLTDNVSVYKTPGHTAEDLSVVVRNVTKLGTVAIVGDLFFSKDDLHYPEIWESQSWNSTLQNQYRRLIICIADFIVPGHGAMFRVENGMRRAFECS